MFEKLTGTVQGPLQVTGVVSVDGTLVGGAVVTGKLTLRGTCEGPLEVHLEGQADVDAVVHGDVHVRGGRLHLRGVLDGRLGIKPGAEVLVAAGSVINGRQLQADGTLAALSGTGTFAIPDDSPLLEPRADGPWVARS